MAQFTSERHFTEKTAHVQKEIPKKQESVSDRLGTPQGHHILETHDTETSNPLWAVNSPVTIERIPERTAGGGYLFTARFRAIFYLTFERWPTRVKLSRHVYAI